MQEENRSDDTVLPGDLAPDDVTGSPEGIPSDPGGFTHPPAAIRPGLTPVQEVAMQRLIAGSSIQQAARAAQIDRRTLSRWLHNDPYFASAYAAWQREMLASGRARVLAMTDIALDAVQNAILQGDGRVALQVAKATGALDAPKPGTTDPAWFHHRQKLRDDARQQAISSAEFHENLKRQRESGDPERLTWRERDVLEQLERKMQGEDVQVEEVTLAPWEVNAINEAREKLLDAGFIPGPDQRVVPGPRDSCGSGRPIGSRKQLELQAVPPRALPAPSPAAPPPPPTTAADPDPAPPPPASPVTAGPDAPPASPAPQAEPAAFQDARAVSSKSADPPPAPPRHRPPWAMAVPYDGSDEMDNEPGWVKIM
jgi:hypothetical protein